MPLTMLNVGKEAVVRNFKVKEETKTFLEGLGIVSGTPILVLSEINGDLIIRVKGSKLAINKGLAQRIFVEAV